MIHIDIMDAYKNLVESQFLAQAAAAVLQNQSIQNADLTIVLTSNEAVQELNHRHRGLDAPTDVLSFEAGYPDPETSVIYLGDIIIAYPKAERQAQKAGHPIESEIQLLTVHGVLHLLGFDHATAEEKSKMWEIQGEILKHLGIDHSTIEM